MEQKKPALQQAHKTIQKGDNTMYNEGRKVSNAIPVSKKKEENMGRFLNHSNKRFKSRLDSEIYVDKTGLIEYTNKVLNTEQAFICNSRPRRFGKTIAADMLAAYYGKGCDSSEMFADLEIGRSASFEKGLNKYDVIHFDVQWCMGDAGSPEKTVEYINRETLSELRAQFPECQLADVETLYGALSRVNAATGNKFIIIIDEWDVLIRDDANNLKVQQEYIDFLRGLFKGTEAMEYIALAYMTGILPIIRQKTESALNNFREFTMLNPGPLAKYMGFTEEEVRTLCGRYRHDFDTARLWYDGYILSGRHIYNPKAVIEAMETGTFQSYWSQTGAYDVVVPLIDMDFDGLKTDIMSLLSGSTVNVDVGLFCNDVVNIKSKDEVLTYLIHLGYLGYDENNRSVFIPNDEIRQELRRAVAKARGYRFLEFKAQSESLLDSIIDMESGDVAESISTMHDQYSSALTYNNETALSSVVTIAMLGSVDKYFPAVHELPTGRGFADLVYVPRPDYISSYPAIVMELKWNKSAATALQQIKDKNYPESLKQYTGDILLVGISYDKKTKAHECVIEKLEK